MTENSLFKKAVALAIVLVVVAFLAIWTAAGDATSRSFRQPAPFAAEADDSASDEIGPSESQIALQRAADELFDRMASADPAFVSRLAQDVDEDFYEATGYRHADLGLDPEVPARWMLEDFAYEISSATVGTDTGAVSVNIEHRAGRAMMRDFYDKAYDFFSSPDARGLDEAAARARMGELYQQALDESTAMDSVNLLLTFTRQDGVWEANEDSLDDFCSELFGIYQTADEDASSSGTESADEAAEDASGEDAAAQNPEMFDGEAPRILDEEEGQVSPAL